MTGRGLERIGDWAWLVSYHGLRLLEEGGRVQTRAGVGVLLVDAANPERVLYRSEEPLPGSVIACDGWNPDLRGHLPEIPATWIPQKVLNEGAYLHQVQPIPSAATRWLREKAARGAAMAAS